jgi:hypothetical protein
MALDSPFFSCASPGVPSPTTPWQSAFPTNPDESCDGSDDWDLIILLSFKDPISFKTFYNVTVNTYDTVCYNIRDG